MSIDIFKRLLNGQDKLAPESEDQLFSPELPKTSWVCFDGSNLADLAYQNPQLWFDTSGWGSLKSIPTLAEGRAIWVEYELTETLTSTREDEIPEHSTAFAVAIQSVPGSPDKLSALIVYGGKRTSEPLIITNGFYITLDPDTGAVKDVQHSYSRSRNEDGSPSAPWAGKRDLFFGLLPLLIGDQASQLGYVIMKRNARRFVQNLHSRDKKKRKAAQKRAKFHYYEVIPAMGVVKSDKIANDELPVESNRGYTEE